MKLNVNDKLVDLPADSLLSKLAEDFSLSTRTGIAIAVNAQVIAKSDWQKYILKEDDNVMIIQASQGG